MSDQNPEQHPPTELAAPAASGTSAPFPVASPVAVTPSTGLAPATGPLPAADVVVTSPGPPPLPSSGAGATPPQPSPAAAPTPPHPSLSADPTAPAAAHSQATLDAYGALLGTADALLAEIDDVMVTVGPHLARLTNILEAFRTLTGAPATSGESPTAPASPGALRSHPLLGNLKEFAQSYTATHDPLAQHRAALAATNAAAAPAHFGAGAGAMVPQGTVSAHNAALEATRARAGAPVGAASGPAVGAGIAEAQSTVPSAEALAQHRAALEASTARQDTRPPWVRNAHPTPPAEGAAAAPSSEPEVLPNQPGAPVGARLAAPVTPGAPGSGGAVGARFG
jgi:hypothetical protein